MKIYILTAFILTISIDLNAQSTNNEKDLKSEKCYIRIFEFDSKYQKKEIDCEKFYEMHDGIITKNDSIINQQYKIKLAKYQEKLIDLGYNFIPNGELSEKFIRAHHKYLRKKKREQRREIRNKTE